MQNLHVTIPSPHLKQFFIVIFQHRCDPLRCFSAHTSASLGEFSPQDFTSFCRADLQSTGILSWAHAAKCTRQYARHSGNKPPGQSLHLMERARLRKLHSPHQRVCPRKGFRKNLSSTSRLIGSPGNDHGGCQLAD